jgi:hypothetical protein
LIALTPRSPGTACRFGTRDVFSETGSEFFSPGNFALWLLFRAEGGQGRELTHFRSANGCEPAVEKMILPSGRNSGMLRHSAVSTLVEIEAAADSLSSAEKEELLRFLAMRLRGNRAMPKPRIYSDEELATMLAEDEADGERFRQEC